MSAAATHDIEQARQAIDAVIQALFNGAEHARLVGMASDSPAVSARRAHEIQLGQRACAGMHMCLVAALAALEVSCALLADSDDVAVDDRERTLRSCASDVQLAGETALRASCILADAARARAV
ncbi:MAG: hypothetical protein EOP76_07370 [Variovorax sp.]|jgi:hypothetical protein|nr:MAG: hypothetical protein EOP76_07370 [Variovorax sp.]